MSILELSIALPVRVQNGGLFISRGVGSHPARKLNSWEIIFVEKGILTIQEESTIFQVNAGESLVLWPERQHIGVGDFPDNLKFYWLHFEMMNEAQSGESLTKLNLPQHVKVSDPPYMISLFRQFLNEQESMARSVALELTLLLILQHVAQGADHQARQEDAGAALAWKAQQCIRTHYHLPLSTSVLAKELHCNADYLGRVYRRIFRLTLTEAIHRQRIRAAEKMLISDARSLKEVAGLCGFGDVSYFRHIFRKYTGLTPAMWKRRYCKEHINSG